MAGDVAYDICVGGAEARCKSGGGSGSLGTLKRRKGMGGGLVRWCLGNESVSVKYDEGVW